MGENAPNQTLYVNNLNEKVKLEELKKSLYHVFTQFGNVLEIQAQRHLKLRGQAWIIFDDLSGATKALREMQGFSFYGKPMQVQFAKVKSDVVSKADGTFQARPKRKSAKEQKEGEPSPRKVQKLSSSTPMETSSEPKKVVDNNPPNSILFVENLPEDCTQEALQALFSETGGFKEARLIPGKPGIAFVEFTDIYSSGKAKEIFQSYQMSSDERLLITYAKQ